MSKDMKKFVSGFGWELFNSRGGSYKLKKDGVNLVFSKFGRGELRVRLMGMVESEDATSVTSLLIGPSSREEYLSDVLPKMTQEKAIEVIRSAINRSIEVAKSTVKLREDDLQDFNSGLASWRKKFSNGDACSRNEA